MAIPHAGLPLLLVDPNFFEFHCTLLYVACGVSIIPGSQRLVAEMIGRYDFPRSTLDFIEAGEGKYESPHIRYIRSNSLPLFDAGQQR